MFKIIFFIFASIYFVQAKHEEYDGHTLYKVTVYNTNQVEYLQGLVERYYFDIWTYAIPGQEGLILVPGDLKTVFEDELFTAGIDYEIDTPNIKEKLDLEDQLLANAYSRSNRSTPGLSFDVIHRYDVVDRYLVDLANRFPRLVTVVSGGRSLEGRDIKYVRISTDNFQSQTKPIVMIQSLLHAREWVTLPVTLYAIEKLVLDVTEQDLQRDVDWIIVPIANPDGYEFTHTGTRMWRKNRRTGLGFCMGVDLNRNYDVNWGTASSNNPCTDTFHGRSPFSEPETQVSRDILIRYRSRLALFIDAHSFGSMILYGFGNGQLPPNALILNTVAVQMAQRIDAVKWPSNRNYVVGNIVHVLYQASGGSSDYAQTVIGQRLSYTFELPAYRNMNTINGFLVDPAFIRQAGYETWEGIKVAARYVARNRKLLNY